MIGEWGATTVRTIDLDYDQFLRLEGRRGTRVKVLYGGVWLTEEGWPEDVFAMSGEEVAVRAHQRSLIEGLGATRIELVEPVAGQRWRALARAVGAAAKAAVSKARETGGLGGAPARPLPSLRATLALLGAVVGVAIPTLVLVGITATAPILAQYF